MKDFPPHLRDYIPKCCENCEYFDINKKWSMDIEKDDEFQLCTRYPRFKLTRYFYDKLVCDDFKMVDLRTEIYGTYIPSKKDV